MIVSRKVIFSICLLFVSQTVFSDGRVMVRPNKAQRSSTQSGHRQSPTYRTRSTQRASSFNPPSRNYNYDNPNYSTDSYKTRRTHQSPSFNPPNHRQNYYRPGYNTHYLPHGSRRVFFNDLEYYYYDRYFYRPYRNEYHVVSGPVGAILVLLPEPYFSLQWNGIDYYFAGDTYYQKHSEGYIIVRNPGFRDRRRR